MNLPKRELPKFNGEVREWLPFWDAFQEIHIDKNIPDVEKFHYLLQSTVVDSAARKIVASYPMTGVNYHLAVDSLKENFGRENILVKVYIRDLLKIVVDNSSNRSNLKFGDLVTTLTSQMRNLEKLGVTKDKCGLILYPIVESCIPPAILKEWMKSAAYKEDVEDILEFLRKEVRRDLEAYLARAPFDDFRDRPAPSSKSARSPPQPKGRESEPKTAASLLVQGTQHNHQICIFCGLVHASHQCRKASKLTLDERKGKVKAAGSCFACLRKGHPSRDCRVAPTCPVCSGRHYPIMCSGTRNLQTQQPVSQPPPNPSAPPEPAVVRDLHNQVSSPDVPLETLYVTLYGTHGLEKQVRCILDPGSQRSYVLRSLVPELQLNKLGEETIVHELFGGTRTETKTYDVVQISVSDIFGQNRLSFNASAVDLITRNIDLPTSGSWLKEFGSSNITFTDFASRSKEIELLIGNDIVPHLYTGQIHKLETGPVALQTVWGWVLGGKLPVQKRSESNSLLVVNMLVTGQCIADLWALESLGIMDSAHTQSRREMEEETQLHFNRTVSRKRDGRYEVLLPFISGRKERLSSNFTNSERRLLASTAKLKREDYLERYHQVFKQWESEGMIERVTEPNHEEGHYLPHRAVLKLTSTTTPIRPVFDASAKSRGGLSLNECLDKGPNTLEQIPAILLRFRKRPVGVTADIRKAFQQISVSPHHRNYLKFLWWTDETCSHVQVFRHTRVVFGVSSSPFLLGATLTHHLNQTRSPLAPVIISSMYVDNLVISVGSFEEAQRLQQWSTELLQPAHFELREWEIGPSTSIKLVPILGLVWDTYADTLSIDTECVLQNLEGTLTQRKVLSIAHTIFDPLGYVSPFTLRAKLILRECHNRKIGWDKALPEDLCSIFQKWANHLPELKGVVIPRYISLTDNSKFSLHAFADASQDAVAAVVYIRVEKEGGIAVHMLQSKARVAPRKTNKAIEGKLIDIPRLELISCLIAARLIISVREALQIPTVPLFLWSDSSVAVTWINRDGPWAVFVQNRVVEIRKLVGAHNVRHVPGKLNPADIPSRGASLKKLREIRFWDGPDWLRQNMEDWPTSTAQPDQTMVEKEMRIIISTNLTVQDTGIVGELSSCPYSKAVRILAYIRRYLSNLKDKKEPDRSLSGLTVNPPSQEEKDEAEYIILQHSQRSLTERETKRFKTYKDDNGLLRIVTRLTHEDTDCFLAPILLSDKCLIARALVIDIHLRNFHAGVQLTLGRLRERYWIVNGRRLVRRVITACSICRRFKARRTEVPQAPLPAVRTATAAPFNTTGVDMAGPLYVREGGKAWICLFTCAVYRAVHMELVESLSTEDFLKALRRFIARRGRPHIIYSDNGLNFTGASRFLRKVGMGKVRQYASVQQIEWRFNPPTAAWWGGFWERLIGMAKEILRRVLGSKVVATSELATILCEVEELLNNRPLTYQAEDNEEPIPLTPNHFIRNSGMAHFPEVEVADARSLRKMGKRMQHLREALRSRFRREYLGQLQQRQNQGRIRELKPGDVVLVELENHKRLEWPLGVVVEAFQGRDGHIRKYRVRTKAGEIERPAQKLYIQELSN